MSHRSKIDRESERDAYRIMTPLMFWVMEYVFYRGLSSLFRSVEWGRFFVGAVVFGLVVARACFVPRSIRTIREH